MAETFWCQGERVKFSNGATELLFRHWLAQAEAKSGTSGMPAVASYLRHQLEVVGDGGRAFGMDRDCYPDALASPDAVSAIAMLVAESAADATRIADIDWDPHHREWWETRLRQLSQAILAWHDLNHSSPCGA